MYPRFGQLTFITPYGLMLVVALLVCWYYARKRAPRFGIDSSHIDLALPLVFAASILASQVFAVVRSGTDQFQGGSFPSHTQLNLFGLLVFAVPALIAYGRLSGLSAGNMLDLFALPALTCLIVTRLGCFMAGCCWGDLTRASPELAALTDQAEAAQIFTLPWLSGEGFAAAVSFPAHSFAWRQQLELGLIGPGAAGSLPVHPTQLYEFALLVVLFLVLRRLEHRWTRPGTTMLVALGSYAGLRFFIEFLRADNAPVLGNLTAAQLICIALTIACFTLITIGKYVPGGHNGIHLER